MPKHPEVIYDFDPHNLPPEMLRAIGLIVMASAQTESIVGHFISSMLGADAAESIALTAHMSNPLKEQVARALIELLAADAETVDAVDDLLDNIQAAYEKRNTIVHNRAVRHPDTNEIFSLRESARGSTRMKLTPITVQEIEEAAASLYEAGIALERFIARTNLPREVTLKRPLRAPLNRKKSARVKRRNSSV